TYADRLSSKLVIMGSSPSDLRQLEHIMEQALAGGRGSARTGAPAAQARPEPAVPHDRARSPALVEEISLQVLCALIDFPELCDDPDVEQALSALEGDTALSAAALRQSRNGQNGLYASEFLAQIAPSIHSFAAGRLASPVFEVGAEARVELLTN